MTEQDAAKEGTRIEIAPHYDLWAQGARFGTIEKVVQDQALVRLDKVVGLQKFPLSDLTKV